MQITDIFMSERIKGKWNTEEELLSEIRKRDPGLYDHLKRVEEICLRIAGRIGLCQDDTDLLTRAGKLHDCGKLGIDPNILNKKGPLTEEEWGVVRTHSRLSFLILFPINEEVAKIVVAHHEYGNRFCYPRNNQRGSLDVGEERRKTDQRIGRLAGLLSLADKFDALSHDRLYKGSWNPQEVREELLKLFPDQSELIGFLIGGL